MSSHFGKDASEGHQSRKFNSCGSANGDITGLGGKRGRLPPDRLRRTIGKDSTEEGNKQITKKLLESCIRAGASFYQLLTRDEGQLTEFMEGGETVIDWTGLKEPTAYFSHGFHPYPLECLLIYPDGS